MPQIDDGDAWHWAELPEELTEVVDRFTGGPSGGWGSVKVEATIGETTWNTSLFLSDAGTYLLPVKQPVRAFGPQRLSDLRRSFAEHDFHIRKLVVEIAASAALTSRAGNP